MDRPLRIVLAKVGLDGHDRGIKVVARALRDAGMHVIYAGLWQTPEAVARAVADEDADWLGLSLLSGAHMTLVPRVLQVLRDQGLADVRVMIGGIIPEADVPRLLEMGVAHVFGPGTSLDDIVAYLQQDAPAVIEQLLQRYRHGDRRALARLISLAACGDGLAEIARGLPAVPAPVRVVAFTGGGGVGKSTLAGRMIALARGEGHKVAVLACDPQSPVSGGALLGDRFRMGAATDDGVFIRSLAALGGRGAVAENLDLMVRLLEGFGFAAIFLETVGAGQGDVAVADLADVVVLLLQPESGDDLQWEKAGILELADIIVVHKADLPGAEQTAAQVRTTLQLSPGRSTPVLLVSSTRIQGHQDLWDAIKAMPPRRHSPDNAGLLRRTQVLLAHRFHNAERRRDPELGRLVDAWRQGSCPPDETAQRLLQLLANPT